MTAAQLVLPKGVKRITFIQPAGAAKDAPPLDVFSREKKKKKMSRGLKGLEKLARRWALAMQEVSKTYVDRHDRSNLKKRDGWLRDYLSNIAKGNREGLRKLRIPVIKL